MYRGRHRHEPQRDTALTRVASTLIRHPVMGPRELFYADIFASRKTGCRSGLGMPGVRDRHSGCVSTYLVEHDLFDFLLLSLPDNDWHSHKRGPEAQVQSIAQADLQLARVMNAAGGLEEFLAEHAVIAMADHSQAPVVGVDRPPGRAGATSGCSVRSGPSDGSRGSPSARPSARRWSTRWTSPSATRCAHPGRPRARDRGRGSRDVARARRPRRPREGVIASPRHGELRFAPGGAGATRAAWPGAWRASSRCSSAQRAGADGSRRPTTPTPWRACGRR